jgi:hypothetical protein
MTRESWLFFEIRLFLDGITLKFRCSSLRILTFRILLRSFSQKLYSG